jgi:lipid-A-disaccharide synthase-like uncharacterized protein
LIGRFATERLRPVGRVEAGFAFRFPIVESERHRSRVNDVLFEFEAFDVMVVVTGWKLIGYAGVFLFASRWFVQFFASRAAGRPVLPRLFWYMSLLGSVLVLAYFTLGKNDSVGILANLFPAFVAAYNLWLDFRHHRTNGPIAAVTGR